MKAAVFNTKPYDRLFFEQANRKWKHDLHFFDVHLNPQTVKLTAGYEAVCVFVNDDLGGEMTGMLAANGVRLIALRCSGFNNVDIRAAEKAELTILRVPAYAPHGVAEYTVAMILALNRKISRAYQRVRDGNFALDGLLGFELCGKTAGVVGTGKIGAIVAAILCGFGCRVLAYDPFPSEVCRKKGVEYVTLDELFTASDLITLHTPLMPETYHLIDEKALKKMKKGVMIVNTSRGGLIDTGCVIRHLKSGWIGSLGLDVYEEETELFFEDLSGKVIQDDVFARLLTFPNVMITGHQAFFTDTALANIAEITLANMSDFEKGRPRPENVVSSKHIKS